MSRQNINVGTNPNDATGDTLRLAFSKVNNNFIELYATSVGTGNSITQGSYSVVIDANGAMSFPTLSTARGDVSSGTLTGQTLKFADKTQEAIIAGPNGDDTYQNAQRIIIEGGLGAANTTGEGGDIYVWAGRGGNYGGSGGDIKVRGGYGPNTGPGGYVRIEGGDAADIGSGGFIDINGGATYDGYGGDVNIRGGYSSNAGLNGNVLIQTSGAYDWKFNSDGTLIFPYNGDQNIRTQRYGMGNVVAYLDNGWTLGEFNGIDWGTEGMRINPGIEGYSDIKLPSDADAANGTPISISSYSANGNVSIYANGNSWLFNGKTSTLTLPAGGFIRDSSAANTLTLSPPHALFGQSLVIRPTAPTGVTSNRPGGFVSGDSIIVTVNPDDNNPVTGTVDYTFTGCSQEQLGRSLTGTLTFTASSAEQISWNIPAQSDITSFTITLSNPSGFGLGGTTTLTVTRNGSSEDNHIHLIAGNTSTVDLYLGDDDQYVKIEKNAGNVVIGTNTNSKQWTFDVDGALKLPGNLEWSSSNTVIQSIPNGDGEGFSVLNIIPDKDKIVTDQYIIIDPGVTPAHIHLRAGGSMDESSAILSLGGDASYFRLDSGPNPSAYIASNTKIWTFNQEGGLDFPDSTTQTTAWSGIPGPYADDAAAAANSVNVGNPYYRSTGLVYVRLA